jgi:hypothetical protein
VKEIPMGKRAGLRVAIAVGAVLVASAARADIIVTYVSTSGPIGPTPEFVWTYNADVTLLQVVESGPFLFPAPPPELSPTGPGFPGTWFHDYFTIYDFVNFVPGSNTQPANWAFNSTVTGLGSTPSSEVGDIIDLPGIPNLTWYYVGSTDIVGPADLGLFTARSSFNVPAVGDYAADVTLTSAGNFASGNDGNVAVPAALQVPEPTSLLLMGSGFLALGLLRLKRS